MYQALRVIPARTAVLLATLEWDPTVVSRYLICFQIFDIDIIRHRQIDHLPKKPDELKRIFKSNLLEGYIQIK